MKNATHIALVLDRSGSMSSIRNATIGGLNDFVGGQKSVPGDCTFTLVQFDSLGIDTVLRAVRIQDAPAFTPENFVPRDYTPLWDAIGKTIAETGDYLKSLPERDRPDKVVFVVMTDGYENASKIYTHAQVKDMVRHQTDAYKWQFVFLGANMDSYSVAANTGFYASNVMNFATNDTGVHHAFASTIRSTTMYRTGQTVNMAYSDEDREEQLKAGADQTGAPQSKIKNQKSKI